MAHGWINSSGHTSNMKIVSAFISVLPLFKLKKYGKTFVCMFTFGDFRKNQSDYSEKSYLSVIGGL